MQLRREDLHPFKSEPETIHPHAERSKELKQRVVFDGADHLNLFQTTRSLEARADGV